MRLALDPFRLLLITLPVGLNQQQQDVIDYLQEENRVLRGSPVHGRVSGDSGDQRAEIGETAAARRMPYERQGSPLASPMCAE